MLHTDARISTTHETEEPVPLQGTLDRFLLRPEQTGWAKLYSSLIINQSPRAGSGVKNGTLSEPPVKPGPHTKRSWPFTIRVPIQISTIPGPVCVPSSHSSDFVELGN